MALYRTYRPASFAEVVGQEHVTEPLSRALNAGRINHAYLFSGPRGCGKTSSARILARSLNCVEGPTATPCGVCDSCVALAPGGPGNLDVVELDAASHGGVDDTRDLRERAFFSPATSRYRVFIIDEAHMVTSAGFNALLKIVEEPPEHLIFIFATTEPEKVLPTIRSRTHHYPFRLLAPPDMRGLLESIVAREGVTVEPAVYPLVTRAGGGSPRDSLSVLDQLLAGADESGVSYDRAVSLLGITDSALLAEALGALAAADGSALFGAVEKVVDSGHDPRRFTVDLLQRLRDVMLLSAVPDAGARGLVQAPDDELETMRSEAQALGLARLTRFAEITHDCLAEMKGTTAPRLLLEVMFARMLLPAATDGDAAVLQRIEALEQGAPATPATRATVPAAPAAPAAVAATGTSPTPSADEPPLKYRRKSTSAPAAATAPAGGAVPAAPPTASSPASTTPAADEPPAGVTGSSTDDDPPPPWDTSDPAPTAASARPADPTAAPTPTAAAPAAAPSDPPEPAAPAVRPATTPEPASAPAAEPGSDDAALTAEIPDTEIPDTDGPDVDVPDTDVADAAARDAAVPASPPAAAESVSAPAPAAQIEQPDAPAETSDDNAEPPAAPAASGDAGPSAPSLREHWQQVVKSAGPVWRAMLAEAVVHRQKGWDVEVGHPNPALAARLAEQRGVDAITALAHQITGVPGWAIVVSHVDAAAAAETASAAPSSAPRRERSFTRSSESQPAATPPPAAAPDPDPEPPTADEELSDAEQDEMIRDKDTGTPAPDPRDAVIKLLESELGATPIDDA